MKREMRPSAHQIKPYYLIEQQENLSKMKLEEISRIHMAENMSYEEGDMTLKQKIDDVINEIRSHNKSTQQLYSGINADGSLNKTVLRNSKYDGKKNQKFMNYVL